MEYCIHGQPCVENLEGHIHQEELEDPDNYEIMEFYQTCDCCWYPMHNEAGPPGNGILQQDGRVLCQRCDEGEKLLNKPKHLVKNA